MAAEVSMYPSIESRNGCLPAQAIWRKRRGMFIKSEPLGPRRLVLVGILKFGEGLIPAIGTPIEQEEFGRRLLMRIHCNRLRMLPSVLNVGL